jgi:hypothetical protein
MGKCRYFAAGRGVLQAADGDEGDDVDVQPPQRRDHRRPDHRRGHDAGVHVELRAGADGHDRLAQRDDHDQPVALGEVARHELPSLGAEEEGAAGVEQQREPPERELQRPVGEGGRHEQPRPERGAGGEAQHRPPQRGVVAAGEHEEEDVRDAHRGVGGGEEAAGALERGRHAEGRDQQRGHRAEHCQPYRASSGSTTLVSHA